PGHSFQLGIRTVLEGELADVVRDVKLWVVLPHRQSQMKCRHGHALAITRDEGKLGFDKTAAGLQRDVAFEYAYASDVQRHAFAFEIEEESVSPGKTVIIVSDPHDILPQDFPGHVPS